MLWERMKRNIMIDGNNKIDLKNKLNVEFFNVENSNPLIKGIHISLEIKSSPMLLFPI
jgi:hypothetical protein